MWLIATFPSRHYDIKEYPAVENYLLSIGKERLEQTGKEHIVNGQKIKARKKTNNKWFETQDSISYWEDFYKPKIVYQELTQGSSFALDNNGEYFISNTGYLITGDNLEYLLKILNSRLIEFAYRTFYGTILGNNGLRWLAQHIINLPIPNCKIPYTTEEINVYKLYNLSQEEINYIESQI